jgi:SAM-dependent methyltransferase
MLVWRKRLDYWLWASYRRRRLDELQECYQGYYQGVVLDIGGRDRGRFNKPRERVQRWIFADSQSAYRPDVVLDAANMTSVADNSIDVVNALELFEHVVQIERSLDECYRVLRPGGTMLMSVPFLSPIHGDPDDWQRWTEHRWRRELGTRGFQLKEVVIMGRIFTVFGEQAKVFLKQLPRGLRPLAQLVFLPLFDLIVRLDETRWVKSNRALSAWHGGYWLRLRKAQPGD